MTTTYILVAGDARVDNLVALADGTETTALVAGPRNVADSVAAAGVGVVRWLGDPGDAALESYAALVAGLVADAAPDVILASTRPADRVLAGAVAARLGAPVLTMVLQLQVNDRTEIRRSAFGGIAEETLAVTGPVVVVADGGTVAADGPATVTVEDLAAPAPSAITITETRPAERAQVDLTRAQRIVSAGRGVKAQEDLRLIEDLAAALDAEIACSRPLAEGVGWFGHDRYVGITGQHVHPALYLAVGISGQLQHAVGARAADVVVAINSDKNCPYFAEADYCVIGDLYQVVPALTEALA